MKKLSLAIRLVAPLIAIAAWSGVSQAQTISINFSHNGNVDTATSHGPIAATDVVGVVAVDNWNDAAGEGSTLANLIDDSGAATTANADWSTANSWGGNADPAPTDPTERMMTTWLDNGGPLTVSNIPYAAYDVYIYGSSDGAGNADRTLGWNVNGTDFDSVGTFQTVSANGDFYNGTLVDGSTAANDPSYLKISGLVGNLSIADNTNDNGVTRSGVSGIQIVEVALEATIRLNIDRDTGNMTLTNNTGSAIDMAGLSILSGSGALIPGNWLSISDNYDEGAAGGVSNDEWLEFVASGSELGEGTLGVATLAQGQSVDLGNAWQKFINEDVQLEYLDASTGETIAGAALFTGTAQTTPYEAGDFDFDGDIDRDDWPTVRDNYFADLSAASASEAYNMGDFNLDGLNDLRDLKAFKTAFLAAGNPLSELTGSPVPEPTTLVLLSMAGVLFGCRRRMRASLKATSLLLAFVAVCSLTAAEANAASIGVSYAGDNGGGTSIQITPAQIAGVVPQSNWNAATGENDTLGSLVDDSGAATGASVTWTSPNTWGGSAAPTDDAAMVNGWLDDGGGTGNSTTVTGIPYSQYDVYVYGSSDTGNGGRGWNVDINGVNFASDPGVWEDPDTENSFFDNTTYVDGSTGANNPTYFLATGLFGDLTITGLRQTINGLDSRGSVSGFQIVESTGAPTVLTLEVNTDTGAGVIKNETDDAINIDFYEITSDPSASLNAAGWNSIQDGGQNGFPQGDGSGNGWEELGGNDDSRLAEFYLDGASTLDVGESLSLGTIYDTSSGVQDDISFSYNDADTTNRVGLIKFVTGGLFGDFEPDGDVDIIDFGVFADAFGSTSGDGNYNPAADSEPDDDVDIIDFGLFADNFGIGTLEAAAVPEPSSGLLIVLGGMLAGACTRRRRGEKSMDCSTPVSRKATLFASLTTFVFASCLFSSLAVAAVTNDRVYSFGEDGLEGPSQGANVGSNNTAPLAANNTADSVGPSPGFLDLQRLGNAAYENVGPSGLARPGAAAGDFGVRFDGADDLLAGTPLNRPEELAGPTAVGNGPLIANYPFNYDNLPGHGLQLWVYPDASAIGSSGSPAAFQSIVADTVLTGGPAINEVGQWTQINSEHIDGTGAVPGSVDVAAGDTWYHVMHHNIHNGGDSFTSILYVDGIAVSANLDTIPVGGSANFVGQLAVGASEVANDGLTPTFGHHFNGVVDDLDMYVYGDNTADGGQDYGTFDLFADNEWIANKIANDIPNGVLIPGDVQKDGDVDDDDVAAFIAGWRVENTLPGAHGDVAAGDWNTWDNGDLNHDGVTDYSDWFILRANHPAPLSLDLGALLAAAAVPEPTSAALLLLGVVGSGLLSGRRRA